MKIAIISDVHNNLVNLKKVLDFCAREDIKEIICCGDLASQETLEYFSDNFAGAIHYTFGNMDEGQLHNVIIWTSDVQNYKNITLYKNFGETELDNKKIAFVHFPREARELCESGKYDFVFYGHTHKPWEEMIGNCKMLNPGNVAGEIYPPTFAVWNTENDKFELIRIHALP
jgi:putative phosphoesterase